MNTDILKFIEFVNINPYSGSKYPNVSYTPDKCVRGTKTPKTRFIIPEWLSGQPERYSTVHSLSLVLSKRGYNIQMYYDIMILGLTELSQRPKCPVEGTDLPFINLISGYRKFSSQKAFAKSLSMNLPESIERNKKVSLSKLGNKYSLGRKVSEETRSNMSKAQKGHLVTDIARQHMSEAHKGKPGSRTGIPHSKEARERMSKSALKRIDNNPEWLETFIKSGNQKTNKGYYRCSKYKGNDKTGKWFYYMSSFEAILLEYSEYDAEVSLIDKCPVIKYEFNNKSKRYTPDILIKFISGEKAIIELKPEYRTKDEINIAKSTAAQNWCKNNGYYYSIITEHEIKLIKDREFSLLKFVKQGVKY